MAIIKKAFSKNVFKTELGDSLFGNVQGQGPDFNYQNTHFKKSGVRVHVLLILALNGLPGRSDIHWLFSLAFLVSSRPVRGSVSKNQDG